MKRKFNNIEKVKTQIKDIELVKRKQLQIATGASKLFIKKDTFKQVYAKFQKLQVSQLEICITT